MRSIKSENLSNVIEWIERTLKVSTFDDVSNNGLQIARSGEAIDKVAFAVDASLASVQSAAAVGAQLLVVHHGVSWGGGIKRLDGGIYQVVKAAMSANLAVAAYHLPLDANPQVGNNYELARFLGLARLKPAFSYHGNVIGCIGTGTFSKLAAGLKQPPFHSVKLPSMPSSRLLRVGICSGGAGDFAEAAQRLGCRLFITGEASWGDVIAAENAGMAMITAGHYETETFGVKALMKRLSKNLSLSTTFV